MLDGLYRDDEDDNHNKTGVATFHSVETNQATLTLRVMDQDIPLGTSDPLDVAPLCRFDVMQGPPTGPTPQSLQIDIRAPPVPSDKAFEAQEETNNKEEEQQESEPDTHKETNVICSVHLDITFTPSDKDRREELYELLNQCSQRKAAAVEKLRQTAVAASRQQMASSEGEAGAAVVPSKAAAVRAGFLNSKQNKKASQPSRLYQWYSKYLGPDSLLRAILPVAQNYVIFAGFVAWMHSKGQLLALPAPV